MPCHHTDTTGTTYIFYVYTLEITKGKNNKKAGSKETTQRDTGEGKIKEYMSCLPQEMWYRQKKNEREKQHHYIPLLIHTDRVRLRAKGNDRQTE